MTRPMRVFTNWARTESSREVGWESPRSEAEVLDVLGRARRAGKRVRPVGSGHSWSAIAVPEQVGLDLGNLRAVLEIDAAARTVRAQGGVQLKALTEALARVGLAMPILGSVSEQTIAGAISTGTHGSSLVHGNLASLVLELTLVTPSGEVLRLVQGDLRLEAARVSLGALGVITEVLLRVAPAFALIGSVETRPILDIAADLPRIAASCEYVKVWWLPETRGAQVFRYHRTPLPPHDVSRERFLDTHVTNRFVFPAVLQLATRSPAFVSCAQKPLLPGMTIRVERGIGATFKAGRMPPRVRGILLCPGCTCPNIEPNPGEPSTSLGAEQQIRQSGFVLYAPGLANRVSAPGQ